MILESNGSGNNWLGISGKEACEEIIIGSVAGMVAGMFGYPFDLTKVRLQAQLLHSVGGEPSRRFRGPLHCLSQTWKEEGFRGLYRGASVPLVGSMAQAAGLFFAYASFQRMVHVYQHGNTYSERREKPALTIPQLSVAAASAGFITSFILTPMELVKCKMQVQMMNMRSQAVQYSSNGHSLVSPAAKFFSSPGRHTSDSSLHPTTSKSSLHDLASTRTHLFPLSNTRSTLTRLPGPLSIIQSIYRDHGLAGFWLGQTGTVFRETGGCAVWFVVKEVVADFLQRRRLSAQEGKLMIRHASVSDHSINILPWESALSGASAGASATLLIYPVDTIKSAIQTEEELRTSPRLNPRPTTFWRAASKMYRAHGFKGFYSGCGMAVARSILTSGIVFVVYDGLRQWLL